MYKRHNFKNRNNQRTQKVLKFYQFLAQGPTLQYLFNWSGFKTMMREIARSSQSRSQGGRRAYPPPGPQPTLPKKKLYYLKFETSTLQKFPNSSPFMVHLVPPFSKNHTYKIHPFPKLNPIILPIVRSLFFFFFKYLECQFKTSMPPRSTRYENSVSHTCQN